jgi:hypothetical protein
VETSASGESTPFSSVPDLNLTSAFPTSTSFRWLVLFFPRGINGFGHLGILTPVIRVCKPRGL